MLKRACLFLRRRGSQTLTVLFLMLVISAFFFMSLILLQSSKRMKEDALRQIGACVMVGANPEYTGLSYPELSEEAMEDIMAIDGVIGIEAMNAESIADALPVDFKNSRKHTGEDPETQSTDFLEQTMSADMIERLGDAVNIIGCSHVELFEHFRRNQSALIEGQYPSDRNRGVIISQELAKLNDIEVGDTITVRPYHTDFSYDQETGNGEETLVTAQTDSGLTVVGIFSTQLYMEISEDNEQGVDVYRLSPYNTLYADYETGCELFDKAYGRSGGPHPISYFSVYVDAPSRLSRVIGELEKVDLDWEQYQIWNRTEQDFAEYGGQIESLTDTAKSMTLLGVLAGAVLFLIALNAVNAGLGGELAAFLSLGESRKRILRQKTLEYVLLSVAVLPLALGLGYGIMKTLALPLLPEVVSVNEGYMVSDFETGSRQFVPLLTVAFSGWDVLLLLLYNLFLSLLGLLLSLYRLTRFNLRGLFAARS